MAKRPQLTGRAAVLAVVVCAIAMSLAYPVRAYVEQRRYIAQLEQQQARELAAIKEQEERRDRQMDPEYQKRVARERLFYCDPGQKCYVVMNEQAVQTKGAAVAKKVVRPPWYQTLWRSVQAADTGNGKKATEAGR